MFDDMAAHNHVSKGIGATGIVRASKLKPPIAWVRRANIACIEADAGAARATILDQSAQKATLPAADFDNAPAAHAFSFDQFAGQFIEVAIERGRTVLRIVVVGSVGQQCAIEGGVESEAAIFA